MRYFLSTLALTALASSCVTALGINCRGSEKCSGFRSSTTDISLPGQTIAKLLRLEIATRVSDGVLYRNGTHIECIDHPKNNGAICAFLQYAPDGFSGAEVKNLAGKITEWGCEVCGSVPRLFGEPGDGNNDYKTHGELTFNYVELPDNYNTHNDQPCIHNPKFNCQRAV